MNLFPRVALVGMVVAALSPCVSAQDLYDTSVLRTFNIQFHDTNWLQLLRANYTSETQILADLEVDGVTYPNVGVRIRGNTSYTALPSGSQKFSLKIRLDHVDPDQELLGYSNINLNNGFRDPTFCREVVYNNYVAQFIPNPRANHVLVTLNGQNWGVYINVQQPNKRMLRDYFANPDGLRIVCSNNPFGPGLRYNGTNPAAYAEYEIQDDGGLANPYSSLIAVCAALTNTPIANIPSIDSIFAIDPSIWSVVLENLITDDDSYVNKGCDFLTYTDPIDGRMHLLQRDANETFSQTSWSPTLNFTSSSRPLLSRVLAVPELRQRYMAHYRTASADLSWDYFGPIFNDLRAMIEPHVQADPKRIYSYAAFQNNFTSTVNLGIPGLGGGSLIGIQQFVNQRATYLAGNAELNAQSPGVGLPEASPAQPLPDEPVYITASVVANGSPVQKVELFYRPSASEIYQRVLMADDGASGDGAAGDGVYGVMLPIAGLGGQRVSFYVAATASNTYGSATFSPPLSEREPIVLEYAFGSSEGIRITEWMYSGASGEFVEFTNMSDTPVDMTGWSFDDSNAVAGAFDLTAFGVVQPGESVIITENSAPAFRAAWGLPATVKVIGDLGLASGNNLGRADQIILFDASAGIADRLDYGDQTYPGSPRTQNASGQTCPEFIGTNTVTQWVLSTVGDAFGSFAASTGEIGTPGSYNPSACASCPADWNDDGTVNFFDLQAFIQSFSDADPSADFNHDGILNFFDVQAYLAAFLDGCP